MERTDKDVLELCKAWFEDIMERSDRLTTGNVSHGSRAIHGTAKSYAEFVGEHLKSRWMPSEEHLIALRVAIGDEQGSDCCGALRDLLNDLKKLREGMRASNPITAADRGTAEEIIINLKRVEKDYLINLTKEIEWLRNQVKKGE